jgi:hypothetical protein
MKTAMMKSDTSFAYICVCSVVALWTMVAHAAPPEATKKAADSKQASATTESVTPSVFVLPASSKDGRDPFFPKSERPFASQKPVTPQGTKPVPVDLPMTLNGIIPQGQVKLAMIEGRTFAEGEEGDVRVNGVKKRIRCLKVKDESAIIELLPEGERRELKMRWSAAN